MPRLTKIYTRQGDDGSTMLGSGDRVPKDHPRIIAYGTCDELNSVLGVAIASGLDASLAKRLLPIQNDLFHLGSDLCFPEAAKQGIQIPQIEERHVKGLEEMIDALNDELPPLENFILPGGSPGAAHLHVARCVCRRAEREVIELRRQEPVGAFAVAYLNRLSDLLFVMARAANRKAGTDDVCWDSHA